MKGNGREHTCKLEASSYGLNVSRWQETSSALKINKVNARWGFKVVDLIH